MNIFRGMIVKKDERYQRLYRQIQDLVAKPGNYLSRLATINAVLHHKMDYFFWTGFYLLDNGELMVGPYQGPLACQVLEKHKGVCWTAIDKRVTVIVPDVHLFPGHIACDARSRSEIAVPLWKDNEVAGVLDVDSKIPGAFDETDRAWLERILALVH